MTLYLLTYSIIFYITYTCNLYIHNFQNSDIDCSKDAILNKCT